MATSIVPIIASAAGTTCFSLLKKPVMDFCKKNYSKVARAALSKIPIISGAFSEYEVLSFALGEAKKHAVKYSHDKSILGIPGKTDRAIGGFFKKTNNESNIDEWDILSNNFDHNSLEDLQELLKQIYRHTDDVDLMQARVAQVFTKRVISNCANQLKPGFVIEMPIVNSKGQKELAKYVLDHKFDLWEGVPAFGFIDPNHKNPPLLCFRSTQYKLTEKEMQNYKPDDFYAVPALIANLHHKGVAWKYYKNGQEKIEAWLKYRTQNCSLKARIFGYSQGGTTACYYLTYKHQYISRKRHEPSFVLSAPGVSKDVAGDWNAIARKPRAIHYLNRGDIFPKVGERLIGDVFEVNMPNKMPAWEAHSALSLLAPRWEIHVVDKEREGNSRMRKAFCYFQKGVGHTLYPFFRHHILPKVQAVIS